MITSVADNDVEFTFPILKRHKGEPGCKHWKDVVVMFLSDSEGILVHSPMPISIFGKVSAFDIKASFWEDFTGAVTLQNR